MKPQPSSDQLGTESSKPEQVANHEIPPATVRSNHHQIDNSKITPYYNKSPGRNLALISLILLTICSIFPWPGLIVSIGLISWTIASFRKKSSTLVALIYQNNNNPTLYFFSSGIISTVALFLCTGILVSRRIEANKEAHRAAAIVAAQKKELNEAIQRETILRAQSDQVAAKWALELDSIEMLIAEAKPRDAYKKLANSKSNIPQLSLNPIPHSISLVMVRYQDLINKLQPIEDAFQHLSEIDANRSQLKSALRRKNWVEAMALIRASKEQLQLLEAASLDVKKVLPRSLRLTQIASQLSNAEKAVSPLATKQRRAIEQEEAKQQREQAYVESLAMICGPKPGRSAWDGEVPGIEQFVKKRAHDPDSIDVEDCTIPVLTQKHCWITTCSVRGKNILGAKILQQKQFSISKMGIVALPDE